MIVKAFVKTLATLVVAAALLTGCERTPEDPTPHVIREIDGCTVYSFREGGYSHYFTRCANTVTTERNYSVPSGKTRRHAVETIETN